ncbi:G-protein coupled receptor 54-like [Antedon mediterranea]|uniref:G-protein coupled receptor 54-like n=1 Tax=Antedon mediterranea TaxID=105859 RepID=UPI003AF5982F
MDEFYSHEDYPSNYTDISLNAIHRAFPIFLATVVFVIGIPANALVIYVIIRNGQMKTVTNIYVFNLAITDVLFITFATPISIAWYVEADFQYGTILCKLQTFLYQTNYAVTVLTLTMLAVDRVYAVVYPVKSRAYSKITIESHFKDSLALRHTVLGITNLKSRFLQYHRNIWTLKGCKLWHTTTEGSTYRINHPKYVTQRRKISTMIMLVVLCFAVCWLPFHVLTLLENFHPLPVSQTVSYLNIFARMLAVCNSCIDPFVYAFVSINFRRSFKCAFYTLFDSDHNRNVQFAPDPDDKLSRVQKSLTLTSRTRSSRSSGNLALTKVGKSNASLKNVSGKLGIRESIV